MRRSTSKRKTPGRLDDHDDGPTHDRKKQKMPQTQSSPTRPLAPSPPRWAPTRPSKSPPVALQSSMLPTPPRAPTSPPRDPTPHPMALIPPQDDLGQQWLDQKFQLTHEQGLNPSRVVTLPTDKMPKKTATGVRDLIYSAIEMNLKAGTFIERPQAIQSGPWLDPSRVVPSPTDKIREKPATSARDLIYPAIEMNFSRDIGLERPQAIQSGPSPRRAPTRQSKSPAMALQSPMPSSPARAPTSPPRDPTIPPMAPIPPQADMGQQWLNQNFQLTNEQEHFKQVLKIGDSVGSELGRNACVGPFVRLQEKGEICFLTSCQIFGRSDINNGMRVVYHPPTEDQKQYICGEVIRTSENLNTVLVKLSDDFIPKHCTFVDIDSDDLSRAGLKIPYKIKGTTDLRKRNPKTYIGRKIVVHCPNGSLLTGKLGRFISHMNLQMDSPGRRFVLHNVQVFIPDTDSPEFLPVLSGSAVFLVEDNNSLSCIGILLGVTTSNVLLFILIHDILDTFSLELGQSVVIETFENKKFDVSADEFRLERLNAIPTYDQGEHDTDSLFDPNDIFNKDLMEGDIEDSLEGIAKFGNYGQVHLQRCKIKDTELRPIPKKNATAALKDTGDQLNTNKMPTYVEDKQKKIAENTGTTYQEATEIGKIVNQYELDRICEILDRKHKLVVQCCESICNMIKSSSEYIIHVYAAYKKENERKIFFVVIVMWDFDLKEHEIGYRIMKRNYNDLSTEGIDINSSIEESDQRISADEHKKLNASMSKYAEKLMDNHRYLNVISGSIVRSKNYTPSAMCLIKETCMALYVLVKGFIPIEEDAFQKTYDGVSVDIREGLFFPYGKAKEYHDNIKMGCKISRLTGMTLDGTLGGFIDHPKYGLCGITCAHVLMFPDELKKCTEQNGDISWPQIFSSDIVCQPDPLAVNKIGRIVQAIYKEREQSEAGVDVALIQIEDRPPKSGDFPNVGQHGMKVPYTYETGKTCGVTRCMEKDLYKFGCTSDLTVGRIIITTPLYVKLSELESNGFTFKLYNQLEIHPKTFATFGDSGSLVFCRGMSKDFECIGMVEGGLTNGTCVVTPIQSILAALKVSSLKNFKTESRFDAIDQKLDSMSSMLEQLVQRSDKNCNK